MDYTIVIPSLLRSGLDLAVLQQTIDKCKLIHDDILVFSQVLDPTGLIEGARVIHSTVPLGKWQAVAAIGASNLDENILVHDADDPFCISSYHQLSFDKGVSFGRRDKLILSYKDDPETNNRKYLELFLNVLISDRLGIKNSIDIQSGCIFLPKTYLRCIDFGENPYGGELHIYKYCVENRIEINEFPIKVQDSNQRQKSSFSAKDILLPFVNQKLDRQEFRHICETVDKRYRRYTCPDIRSYDVLFELLESFQLIRP